MRALSVLESWLVESRFKRAHACRTAPGRARPRYAHASGPSLHARALACGCAHGSRFVLAHVPARARPRRAQPHPRTHSHGCVHASACTQGRSHSGGAPAPILRTASAKAISLRGPKHAAICRRTLRRTIARACATNRPRKPRAFCYSMSRDNGGGRARRGRRLVARGARERFVGRGTSPDTA